jgi:hypothetical protein
VTTDAASDPRRRSLGILLVVVIGGATAAVLVVPTLFVWGAVLGTLAAVGRAPGDPTWNDGDLAINWVFGALPTLVVMAIAGAAVAAVARRFGLRPRLTWVGTAAGALAVAMAVSSFFMLRGL